MRVGQLVSVTKYPYSMPFLKKDASPELVNACLLSISTSADPRSPSEHRVPESAQLLEAIRGDQVKD